MEIDFEWLKNELRLRSMSEQERQALEEAIEPMFVLPASRSSTKAPRDQASICCVPAT